MGPVTVAAGSRVYLDANAFIYAAETPNAFPNLMRPLDRVNRGDLIAVTSTLTLAEVLVVPLRTGNVARAALYRNRLTSTAALTVVDVSRAILIRAAEIRAVARSAKLPDAIHAATADVSGCTVFLTNDTKLRTAGVPVVVVADLA